MKIIYILICLFLFSGCYSRNYYFKGKWGGDYSNASRHVIGYGTSTKRCSFNFSNLKIKFHATFILDGIKKIRNVSDKVYLNITTHCHLDGVAFKRRNVKKGFMETYEDSSRKVIIEKCEILLWTGSKLRFSMIIRDSGEDKQLNTADDNVYNIETKETFELVRDIQTVSEYFTQNMS